MHGQLPVVALIGRPNVGKSTLFNRLTGRRDALVADRPGVTRDRHYGYAHQLGRRFLVVDTGGLGQEDETVDALAAKQTDIAIKQADVVLFVVDARDGALPGDYAITSRLRGVDVPVFLVVNKSEGLPAAEAATEFHALGLGEPYPVSAEHGDRMQALLETVTTTLPPAEAAPSEDGGEVIRLAVVGRPNAGKSTLVNRLLGEERMLALDQPGTTRDAVTAEFTANGQHYQIVDTAGIRRRTRINDPLEKFSVIKALQAAEAAQIVIFMLDAQSGLSAQDARLLGLVIERGRGVVVAINKWDGLEEDARNLLRNELAIELPFYDFMPLCFTSALHGSGLGELLTAVRKVHASCFADLSTPNLSRALEQAVAAHPPPASQGRRVKLRYAHQGGRNPPRIVIHGTQTENLSSEYKRYLERRFRKAFSLTGTPIQLVFKTGHNPYATEPKSGKPKFKRD